MIHFDSFSISKREIIVSIAIVAIMIIFGLMIHGAISESLMLKYQEYNTALQIDNNPDMFKYAMSTDIGNAFIYGEVKTVDPVTYEEIGGEYSYVKKVKEKYTKHTRTVTETYTDANGNVKTRTRTETYWSWDYVDSWSQHANKITFLEAEFNYGTIDLGSGSHVKTIKESSHIRYVYYGAPTTAKGTLYSKLKNNTINSSTFYEDMTIDQTIEHLESGSELVLFWIGWILLTCLVVFGFIYIDNTWLEDKHRRY